MERRPALTPSGGLGPGGHPAKPPCTSSPWAGARLGCGCPDSAQPGPHRGHVRVPRRGHRRLRRAVAGLRGQAGNPVPSAHGAELNQGERALVASQSAGLRAWVRAPPLRPEPWGGPACPLRTLRGENAPDQRSARATQPQGQGWASGKPSCSPPSPPAPSHRSLGLQTQGHFTRDFPNAPL